MILPLEKQVCSLESAKRLKELGFSQDGLFYWYPIHEYEVQKVLEPYERAVSVPTGNILRWEIGSYYEEDYYGDDKDKKISAYTAAELGELLPKLIGKERLRLMRASNGIWVCTYGFLPISPIKFNNEAEARAKMLIYLAENNLLTPSTERKEI